MTDLLENILSKTPSHSFFFFFSPESLSIYSQLHFHYFLSTFPAVYCHKELLISRITILLQNGCCHASVSLCLYNVPKILSSDREFHYNSSSGQLVCKLTPPFCLELEAKPFLLLCHTAVQSFLACLLHFIKIP